jgi:amidase
MSLHYRQLVELAELIRRRELSPVELTNAHLERIAAVDHLLESYTEVFAQAAMSQARQAESEIAAGRRRGPLHGIPVALKDIFDVAGAPTRAGMPLRSATISMSNATVTRRLLDAGAILLGKLNMTEGALSEYRPPLRVPKNPWNRDRYAGVSSSGNGVAVAAGLCVGSVGSDTGGSIRLPSAANGVTGLKPTWGRVSRHGVFALAPTLDVVGPMCRSAADCAALLRIIAGSDEADPTAAHIPVPDLDSDVEGGVAGLRIGVDENWISRDVEEPIKADVRRALAILEQRGATLVEVAFPDASQAIEDWASLCAAQAAVVHETTFPSQRREYGQALAQHLERGREITGMEYYRMEIRRRDFQGRVAKVFTQVDVLAAPAMAFVPPPAITMVPPLKPETQSLLRRFTAPFAMSGNPTITVPAGLTPDGLPTAVQFIARHFGEAALIRTAGAFQAATDWHSLHPPI